MAQHERQLVTSFGRPYFTKYTFSPYLPLVIVPFWFGGIETWLGADALQITKDSQSCYKKWHTGVIRQDETSSGGNIGAQVRGEIQGTGATIVPPNASWIFPPIRRSQSLLAIYSRIEHVCDARFYTAVGESWKHEHEAQSDGGSKKLCHMESKGAQRDIWACNKGIDLRSPPTQSFAFLLRFVCCIPEAGPSAS